MRCGVMPSDAYMSPGALTQVLTMHLCDWMTGCWRRIGRHRDIVPTGTPLTAAAMDIDALLAAWEAEQRHHHDDHATSMGCEMGQAAAAAAVTTTAGTAVAAASQPGAAAPATSAAAVAQQWAAKFKHARELEKQIKNTRPAATTNAAATNTAAPPKSDYAHEKQLFTLRRR